MAEEDAVCLNILAYRVYPSVADGLVSGVHPPFFPLESFSRLHAFILASLSLLLP